MPAIVPGQTFARQFGDARDGDLVGPDQVNFDFSAFKNFSITERQKLQFRVEMFNIFNHPQFGLLGRNPNNNGGAQRSTGLWATTSVRFSSHSATRSNTSGAGPA